LNSLTIVVHLPGYNPAAYGEGCAEFYDQIYPRCEPGTIELLVALARGGKVLDLGSGTGRVALPLAQKGVEVHGIEASPAMVANLRRKRGGAALPVTIGNFADVAVSSDYSLIFSVVNTFLLLPSNEEQRRCFRNVAQHLVPGGLFLLEIFEVANETGIHQTAETADRSSKRSEHFVDTPNGLRLYAVEISSVTIPELDAMAAGAQLRLRDRWSNWRRESFQQSSHRQISVYERA
jgi:SAM-dependent methyltransferase